MCECSLLQWGRWEGGKETEISCMRKMISQVRDLGREVEDGKGSVGEGKPEVVKRMELRSKRTGGVAEEDMEDTAKQGAKTMLWVPAQGRRIKKERNYQKSRMKESKTGNSRHRQYSEAMGDKSSENTQICCDSPGKL